MPESLVMCGLTNPTKLVLKVGLRSANGYRRTQRWNPPAESGPVYPVTTRGRCMGFALAGDTRAMMRRGDCGQQRDRIGAAMDGLVVAASRFGERGLAKVGQIIEHLQLRLRAVERSRDPEVKRWIADTRARVASGEVARQIKEQPDDPRDSIGRSAAS